MTSVNVLDRHSFAPGTICSLSSFVFGLPYLVGSKPGMRSGVVVLAVTDLSGPSSIPAVVEEGFGRSDVGAGSGRDRMALEDSYCISKRFIPVD